MKHLFRPNLASFYRPSTAFRAAWVVSMTIAPLVLPAGVRAQENGAPPAAAGEPQRVLPAVSVLGVIYLDDAGHVRTGNAEVGQGDAILAENAITRSRAFHLVGRDLIAQQTVEIKMDAEGFVIPSSAQKFGHAVGIERFLQVVVADPSATQFQGEVSESTVPANGTPVPGKIDIDSGNSNSNGKTFNPFSPKKVLPTVPVTRRNFRQTKVTIRCRFTAVATGDVDTRTYQGIATADGQHCDEHQVRAIAMQDAFDNFQADLSRDRPSLMGKITEIDVKECQAAIDIGKEDGITKGTVFEICQSVRKVGGIIHLEPVCDAVVSDVEPHVAVLDIGEYKQKDYFHKDLVFRPNRDKAALVQKGYVIREKK